MIGRFLQQLMTFQAKPSSLRSFLIMLSMGQIILTGGMVSFLSFQNGRTSVADLSDQLRSELTKRVHQELQLYFEIPHKVNRLNAAAYRRGDLDVLNASKGEVLLHEQLKLFPTIAFAYCGTPDNGEFFGVLRDFGSPLSPFQLSFSNPSTNFLRQYYRLNTDGDRQAYLYQRDDPFDSRERLWFGAAQAASGSAWTEVYLGFTSKLPNITASTPVYNREGRLIAVCATDVGLPQEFRTFLQNLELGEGGKAFVIDRAGRLIATSPDGSLTIEREGQEELREGTESTDPLIRATSDRLIKRFGGNLTNINNLEQLNLVWNNESYLVEILPFQDEAGLDWLIVVVIPENSFMEQVMATIDTNTQHAILLCSLAVLILAAIGFWVAHSVTDPILQINEASKQIAAGNLDKVVPLKRHDEIGELAMSFNEMAKQLKQSFAVLENQKNALENQKNAFARFFPPEYLDFLDKDDVTQLELGEHVSKDMGVMFSDIRDFTALAESMTPQESFDFINTYLRNISPEIRKHHGFVVKFLGDGLMAVFPNSADDAIEAGIAKCRMLRDLNHRRALKTDRAIAIGIGIHMGHIMVGTIGDRDRLQADVLSDGVNLCARLEGLTKVYQVPMLLSENAVRRLQHPDQYEMRLLDRVIVKGRKEAIAIYEALDAESPLLRELKLQTRSDFDQALTYYQHGQFDQAEQTFKRVLKANPVDQTIYLFLERIDAFRQQPPKHWTGIWAFTEK